MEFISKLLQDMARDLLTGKYVETTLSEIFWMKDGRYGVVMFFSKRSGPTLTGGPVKPGSASARGREPRSPVLPRMSEGEKLSDFHRRL
jgi:hypothetical protein